MDRREMLKGAAAGYGAAMLGVGFAYGEHTQSLGLDVADGVVPAGHPYETMEPLLIHRGSIELKPYDPIAVLEAMRDGEHEVQIMFSPRAVGRVYVHYNPSRDAIGVLGPPRAFPDFLSAVQWLHRQAAAADAEFAKAFPVPEGE